MEKRHRIFIAISLPNDIKKQLATYEQKWKEVPAKWTSANNMHVTLEFLGNLTDEELGEVCMIVKEVSQRHRAFSINLNKVGYGPEKKIPPKVIWVEAEASDEFLDLKEDMQEYLLERVSFKPESRKTLPHVTLARILEWEWRKLDQEDMPEIFDEIDLSFFVESIEVMESVLKKGGPEYTVLESHSFIV